MFVRCVHVAGGEFVHEIPDDAMLRVKPQAHWIPEDEKYCDDGRTGRNYVAGGLGWRALLGRIKNSHGALWPQGASQFVDTGVRLRVPVGAPLHGIYKGAYFADPATNVRQSTSIWRSYAASGRASGPCNWTWRPARRSLERKLEGSMPAQAQTSRKSPPSSKRKRCASRFSRSVPESQSWTAWTMTAVQSRRSAITSGATSSRICAVPFSITSPCDLSVCDLGGFGRARLLRMHIVHQADDGAKPCVVSV